MTPTIDYRRCSGALGAVLVLLVGHSAGFAQTTAPAAPPPDAAVLPMPRLVASLPKDPMAPPPGVPINLPTALRLALTSNLEIAQARELVAQASARLDRARVALLPNFNIGSAYNHHEGNIQKTEGNIEKVNRDSLFVGGGPSLTFSTTEALFGALAARQLTAAVVAGRRRVDQETLLAVADAYLNVLRARRRVARVRETLEQLLSEQPHPLRAGSRGMLPLIRSFVEVKSKEVFPADLERVRVEVARRQDELVGALNELRLATADLARLLRLDPAVPLEPIEDFRYPISVPVDGWPERPIEQLVEIAFQSRPELAENRALVRAALDRVKAAQWRPFLPNANLNYAWGDFGGGPDLNPPLVLPPARPGGSPRVITVPGYEHSGTIRHFAPRTDFDASLFWRLDNLGFGNRAEQREQESVHRGTVLRQLQVEDRIVTQVVQARELVQGWRERVNILRASLFNAQGAPEGPVFLSIRLSFERIRGGEGRPLELLDSIRSLSDVLEAYGQAVTEYERAEVRLLFALGLPLEALGQADAGQGHEKH